MYSEGRSGAVAKEFESQQLPFASASPLILYGP